MSRTYRFRAVAALAGAAAATVLAATPAVAIPVTDTPTAATTLTAPKGMAAANGHLFVADGNSVAVLTTNGLTETTLGGMLGARDVLATPQGDKVYVALSQASAIAVIDTSTLAEVARYTTSACPVHLALAGSRLFYGTGCGTDWTGGIGSVDAVTGTDPQTVATGFYTAPLLAGAAGTLAAGEPGLSPAAVTTYSVDGSTTTELASGDVGSNLGGLSVSPDGTKVAAAAGSPYHLSQFDAATLAAAGTFDTGPYPKAVAYSHDGTMLGGGIDSTYGPGGNVVAFDLASGAQVLSGNAHPKAAYNRPGPVAGTLTWSADDSRLYVLLDDWNNGVDTYYLASGFDTIPAPAKTTTQLRLTAPATAGAKVRATATVVGHPGVAVRFVRASPVGSVTVTAKTNSSGVATAQLTAPAGGTVTAYYDGDDFNRPSSAKATYKTVTKASAKVSGQYKTVNKVAYFHSKRDVLVKVAVSSPVPGRTVTIALQHKAGATWRTDQTQKFTLDRHGVANIGFSRANAHVQYRFVVRFTGDKYGKASSTTSATVVIG